MAFRSGGISTRVQVSGQPTFLAGDVVMTPAGHVQLIQVSNGIWVTGDAGIQYRSAELFAPGVLAARTLMVMRGLSPSFLRYLDGFFRVAPAGVSAVSRAKLRIQGSTSGLLDWPFDVATAEYHLDAAANSSGLGRAGNLAANGALFGDRGKAQLAKTTAALDVSSVGIQMNDAWVAGTGSSLRVGLASAFKAADGITLATIPWLTTLTGQPAFTDILSGAVVSGPAAAPMLVQLPGPTHLAQATNYAAVMIRLTAADTLGPRSIQTAATDYDPNLAVCDVAFEKEGLRCLAGANLFTTGAAQAPSGSFAFTLFGSVAGFQVVGDVTFSIVMDGAPATPGTDLMVHVAL